MAVAGARHEVDGAGRRFPLAAFVLCGGAALALFFEGTVPAFAERDQLRQMEEKRRGMLDLLQRQNDEAARIESVLEQDPQTLLLEIDELGLTPDELLAQNPEAPPANQPTAR